MAYTPAQIEALKAIKDLDYDKATAFGKEHGISPRSVVAKARALQLPYKPKAPGAKATTATKAANVRRKSEIATNINELMDENLKSLDKLTAEDLAVLEKFVETSVERSSRA
jgi:hypothetical protein